MAPSPPPPSQPSTDDALLARLNALKKSSVSLDTTPALSGTTPSSPPQPPSSQTNDLAARFARLGSASPSATPPPSSNRRADIASGPPTIAPGASSYLEGVAEGIGSSSGGDVEFNEEDEKSLEELLAELEIGSGGGNDESTQGGSGNDRPSWDVDDGEERDVKSLVRDIRSILPDVRRMREEGTQEVRERKGKVEGKGEGLTDWENVEFDVGGKGVKGAGERSEDHEDDDENGDGDEQEDGKKKSEDEEANDVIARVMAELAIAKKYDNLDDPSPPSNDNDDEEPSNPPTSTKPPTSQSPPKNQQAEGNDSSPSSSGNTPLTLPSAPTTTLPRDSLTQTQSLEDALTARFASLSPSPHSNDLTLPSAPSFSPAKKPPKVTAKFTDEEIESWCVICNDDATLKCLGCDGDLYCRNCWMEGHRSEGAGYEERRHRAVVYSKDGEGGGGERKQRVAAAG
ncbi:hypothetical protein BU24DRAFT_234405 [Aaosphaeria arxii CBS 175.79]|uniref:Uncharacterized protein n=1 Tax=Aaosphaeria arxii CBS 175.79 TaxID=1450172 RepID=A0A6A5XLV2_9PLEO|nr:uncharacterized protein BU24DRAFT_234405 [Aaosphaeria arxii CBS 175.79]KAF2013294.1 hypothetical protein BU24DRAFT_234405 [Aaosphaeria arxii CBS 175.79]